MENEEIEKKRMELEMERLAFEKSKLELEKQKFEQSKTAPVQSSSLKLSGISWTSLVLSGIAIILCFCPWWTASTSASGFGVSYKNSASVIGILTWGSLTFIMEVIAVIMNLTKQKKFWILSCIGAFNTLLAGAFLLKSAEFSMNASIGGTKSSAEAGATPFVWVCLVFEIMSVLTALTLKNLNAQSSKKITGFFGSLLLTLLPVAIIPQLQHFYPFDSFFAKFVLTLLFLSYPVIYSLQNKSMFLTKSILVFPTYLFLLSIIMGLMRNKTGVFIYNFHYWIYNTLAFSYVITNVVAYGIIYFEKISKKKPDFISVKQMKIVSFISKHREKLFFIPIAILVLGVSFSIARGIYSKIKNNIDLSMVSEKSEKEGNEESSGELDILQEERKISSEKADPIIHEQTLSIRAISASSFMKSAAGMNYSPDMAMDGDLQTWWSPKEKNNCWLQIDFDGVKSVSAVEIHNGSHFPNYKGYVDLYYKNSRITKARLEFSNGEFMIISLKEVDQIQKVKLGLIQTSYIKLIPLEWTKGEKWDDICVSHFLAIGD